MPPLFVDVADTVCSTSVLPRKELFEAWEVASRIDTAFPSVPVVADLAAGHGLLAWILVLLGAARGARRRAVCVDTRLPDSALTLSSAFIARWPELEASVQYVEGSLDTVSAEPGEAVFASLHACGPLSDMVIEKAVVSGCPLALMPCCHSLRKQPLPPLAGLDRATLERMAAALGQSDAIDACRVAALRGRGYSVEQQYISSEITPYNRLILAHPSPSFDAEVAAALAAASTIEELPKLKRRRARTSGPNQQWPSIIALGDVTALSAVAGRRPPEWSRSIDLSMWAPDEGSVTPARLLSIAAAAVSAPWAQRGDDPSLLIPGRNDSAVFTPDGHTVPPWNASAVVAASARLHRRRDGSSWEQAEQNGEASAGDLDERTETARPLPAAVEDGSGLLIGTAGTSGRIMTDVDGVRVTVSLREVFFAPETRRRACAYTVEFRSSERAIAKGDVKVWQARMREALQQWSADGGGLELR
jgi:hypothetical protein